MTPDQIIKKLGLIPLPEEGGYYKETYRAKGLIPAKVLTAHEGDRNYSTAIYYLITPTEFSVLHRLPQEEVFHFYAGDPVKMLQIDENGNAKEIILGSDILKGQEPQVVVMGNTWQGTRLVEGGHWALLGCTVAPGFDFRDFGIQSRAQLTKTYPQHQEKIAQYTR